MPSRLVLAAAAAVAALHTAFVLALSHHDGRLSVVPLYDDVAYLSLALDRLDALYRGGFRGLLASFAATDAHAPLSELFAMTGYALFGRADWAPYALNGLWVMLFLALIAALARRLATPLALAVGVVALATPMFSFLVGEYRPDVYWGLLVGLSAMLAVERGVARGPAAALGLLGGIALLSKPSASPASAAVLGTALLAALTADWLERRDDRRALWRGALRLAAVLLAVALPYLVVSADHIYQYITTVMRTQRDIWATQGTWRDHALFYVEPGRLAFMLGWTAKLAGLAVVNAAIWAWRRDTAALARLAGGTTVLAVAYAIPSISTVKSMFIGSLFYGTLLAYALWNLVRFLGHLPWPRRAARAAGLALAGATALLWVPVPGTITRSQPNIAATDLLTRQVHQVLAERLRQRPPAAVPVVFVTSPGPVYDGSLRYMAKKEGLQATFHAGYTFRSLDAFRQTIAGSAFVVATEPGGSAESFAFPGLAFQAEVLALLRADPAFALKGEFRTGTLAVYLFERL